MGRVNLRSYLVIRVSEIVSLVWTNQESLKQGLTPEVDRSPIEIIDEYQNMKFFV